MLTLTRHPGPETAPPLLIVHGLFGSGRNWGAIAKRLSDDRQVIAVDMRNHAGSFWSDVHDYPALAADLAEVIAAEGQALDVLGHSMGGKAAMWLALTRSALVRSLIVADIAPVAYGHSQNHLVAAMRGLDLSGLTARGEADRRLAGAIPDPQVRAFLLQSLDLKSEPPRWRLNLPALRREMPKITDWPDGVPQATFAGPALFIAGALSDYVGKDGEAAMHAYFPQARLVRLKDAGHWLHADAPEALAKTMALFLGDGAQGG